MGTRSLIVVLPVAIAAAAVLSSSCSGDDDTLAFTDAELAKIKTLSPLPPLKPDPTNRYADDPAAAALGQKLFFETRFSGPILPEGAAPGVGGVGALGESGKVACATCHQANAWFQDARSVPNACSVATGWTGRNSPPLVNVGFYDWYFWDGRADALWVQALMPLEATTEMNTSRLHIAHVIYANYKDEYNKVFDPDLDPDLDLASPNASRFPDSVIPPADVTSRWSAVKPADQDIINRIYVNVGKAIAAYERLLISRNSAFDRYVAGDESAISSPAKRGLKLFLGKAACVVCHEGPFFSDNKFHNTGVPQLQGDVAHVRARDTGRLDGITALSTNTFNTAGPYSDNPDPAKSNVTATPGDRGAFRTKGLREVAVTGPFMHGGQLSTLEEVIEHYNAGGGPDRTFDGSRDKLMSPLNLSAEDKAALVELMKTLTGDPIPADLMRDSR